MMYDNLNGDIMYKLVLKLLGEDQIIQFSLLVITCNIFLVYK